MATLNEWEQLDARKAEEVIDAILAEQTGKSVCFTCSFQAEDVVVLHLLRKKLPNVPVLFLETGYHFQDTYDFRDRLANEWGLQLVNVLPKQTVAEQRAIGDAEEFEES